MHEFRRSRVADAGRVVIPAEYRKAFRLEEGTEVIRKEPGGQRVEAALNQSLLSAVKLAEVVSTAIDHGGTLEHISYSLQQLPLSPVDLTPGRCPTSGPHRSRRRIPLVKPSKGSNCEAKLHASVRLSRATLGFSLLNPTRDVRGRRESGHSSTTASGSGGVRSSWPARTVGRGRPGAAGSDRLRSRRPSGS
jgi:AbrB family looped-hinge helix DNA binding protein